MHDAHDRYMLHITQLFLLPHSAVCGDIANTEQRAVHRSVVTSWPVTTGIMGTSLWTLALTLLQVSYKTELILHYQHPLPTPSIYSTTVIMVKVCAGIRRQTVLTPLAPLRDLFSLLQAFPQGGALASPENIDRVQCQIRWSYQAMCINHKPNPFSDSYIFPCAFTRGSNYYVRPNFVR